MLNSGNAGIVVHRAAQIGYGVRAQARRYARELAGTVNKQLAGEVTVFVYEEAFGATDRLHWLLHLQDLTSYHRLLERMTWCRLRSSSGKPRAPAQSAQSTSCAATPSKQMRNSTTQPTWDLAVIRCVMSLSPSAPGVCMAFVLDPEHGIVLSGTLDLLQ